MPGIADIFRLALQLVVNLTDQQREYLKWRSSDEGKKCFDRIEENNFYNALLDNNTNVLDVGIAERQERIKKLKESLGLVLLVAVCCLGCSQLNPAKVPETPEKTPAALKTTERTYVIRDMWVEVPQEGKQYFGGTWHIVSHDFMIDHIRNQNDLISTLEQLKESRAKESPVSPKLLLLGFIVGTFLLFWYKFHIDRQAMRDRINNP